MSDEEFKKQHPRSHSQHRTEGNVPPWRKQDPLLFKRRRVADQYEDTQKRVEEALKRAWGGEVLADRELEHIAQMVLLDLLSSLDPLARAVAARELLELRKVALDGAKARALRAKEKRESLQPESIEQVLAENPLAQLNRKLMDL